MKNLIKIVFILCLLIQTAWTSPETKIIQIKGEVKVRCGLEENWQPAMVGMLLKDIDTILAIENAEVLLEIGDGITFRLGGNAVLDIGDLRKITERDLFLYLMSEKVDTIKPRKKPIKLRIPNVSVVHSEFRDGKASLEQTKPDSSWWRRETNGARALFAQEFYPNAAVKLHKILKKYPNITDCGETHFYLGKTFEALNKPGQALEAYQNVLDRSKNDICQNLEIQQAAQEAIESLKDQQ